MCSHVSGTGEGCRGMRSRVRPFVSITIRTRRRSRRGCNPFETTASRVCHRTGWRTEPRTPIDKLEELRGALSDLFNAGMAGEVTTNRLTALSSVANALMKSIEGSDLEARIAALEEKRSRRRNERKGPVKKDRRPDGSNDETCILDGPVLGSGHQGSTQDPELS